MIDFDDPAQTTHNGETIPINTQAKYDAGLAVMHAFADHFGVPLDEANYEARVRQGQTLPEIIVNTFGEALRRVLS